MNTENPAFEKAASQIAELSNLQDLFESCAQLMAEALVNGKNIFSIGLGAATSSATQFSDLLLNSADDTRPPLPAIFLRDDQTAQQQFLASASEGDFAILFNGPDENKRLDGWLDSCLNHSVTSVLINPDLNQFEPTDKALEIRLEYSSFTDYLFYQSAISNYLTKSIEKQLFGRQT